MLVLELSGEVETGLKIRLLLQLITGWMLAFLFQVAHVVDDVEFPTPEESNGTLKVKGGWAAMQVQLNLFQFKLFAWRLIYSLILKNTWYNF